MVGHLQQAYRRTLERPCMESLQYMGADEIMIVSMPWGPFSIMTRGSARHCPVPSFASAVVTNDR
jgi:hypothetical protein